MFLSGLNHQRLKLVEMGDHMIKTRKFPRVAHHVICFYAYIYSTFVLWWFLQETVQYVLYYIWDSVACTIHIFISIYIMWIKIYNIPQQETTCGATCQGEGRYWRNCDSVVRGVPEGQGLRGWGAGVLDPYQRNICPISNEAGLSVYPIFHRVLDIPGGRGLTAPWTVPNHCMTYETHDIWWCWHLQCCLMA